MYSQAKYLLPLIKLQKLVIAAAIIGFMSTLLAITLKRMTEQYESKFFIQAEQKIWPLLVFPVLGLSLIYLLRQYLFEKKPNKGITEIFEIGSGKVLGGLVKRIAPGIQMTSIESPKDIESFLASKASLLEAA